MFALGEVICFYTTWWIQLGIIIIMPFCVCKIVSDKSLKTRKIVYCCMLALGFLNVRFRGYDGAVTHEKEEYMEGDYSISCLDKQEEKTGYIETYGIIENIRISTKTTLTVKTGKRRYLVSVSEGEYDIGQKIYVKGRLLEFEMPTNPGEYNMKQYYVSKGIYYGIDDADVTVTGSQDTSYQILKRAMYKIKNKSVENMYCITDEETAGIYCGLILGEGSMVDEGTKALYQRAGIAHILAISGLHISLIGMGIYRLLRKMKLRYFTAGTITISVIIMYGFLTGFRVATVRAVIMIILAVVGEIIGRTYDTMTAMAAAFLVMNLYNPDILYDSGMRLSFVAVFGVIYGKYVMRLVSGCRHIKKLKSEKTFIYKMISAIIMSLSINLVTLPVISNCYYQLPTYSVLVNLLVLPLMTPVVICGIFALITSYFSMPLAGILILPGKMILSFYDTVCTASMVMPGSVINIGHLMTGQIVLYYITLLLPLFFVDRQVYQKIISGYGCLKKIRYNNKLRRVAGAILVFALLACHILLYYYNRREMVAFLDVGQGDGILIRPQMGTNIVIDGGSTSSKNIGKNIIVPALKYYGMAEVDYWFVTHTDADHISGLEYILQEGENTGIKINRIVVPAAIENEDEKLRDIVSLAEDRGTEIIYMSTGDKIENKKYSFVCLSPDRGMNGDANQKSLVLRYDSEKFGIMLTGDADAGILKKVCDERLYEEELKKEYKKHNILKLAHHGSSTSLCEELYENYGVAVASCGENNSYGHPHKEVVSALKEKGITVLRTDMCGAIVISE